MAELWKRDTYRTSLIDSIKNVDIREYDASAAGLNVLIREGALKESQITSLTNMNKLDRNVRLGMMLRNNKELAEIQKRGFANMRRDFMEANGITEENVISIKKDAFFLLNKPCHTLKVDNILFKEANRYSSYYFIDKKELYFSRALGKTSIDVKGIDDTLLELHANGMMKFLKMVFFKAEANDVESVIKYINKTAIAYKLKQLPLEYYREFNHLSLYRLALEYNGTSIGIENTHTLDGIDISYNYMHIILKLYEYF